MPKTPAVVDLGDEFVVDDTPVPTTLVKGIFGEDFHVVHDVNLFSMMALADDEGERKLSDIQRMMISLIADDEKVRFRNLIARQRHLTAEQIGKLFNRLMEVASGDHPTSSSGGSSRTTRVKAVGRASAAS